MSVLVNDPFDVRLAHSAGGLLQTFNAAGVLTAADVHVAVRIGKLGNEPSESVQLAIALAVRAVRLGSVCIDLATLRESTALDAALLESASIGSTAVGSGPGGLPPPALQPEDLPWPQPADWVDAVLASPLTAVGPEDDSPALENGHPLRYVDGLLYLDRYWRQEELIRRELDDRAARPRPVVDPARLRAALHRLWPGPAPDRQRLAAAVAALSWGMVLAGGPGTGKTTTVARLLALLHDQPAGPPLRVALVAPTGKAAARLQEAVRAETAKLGAEDRARVGEPTASTVHRLLGWRPDRRGRFRHDRSNRLPYDVVVVDETSMVSLTLMSRLLEAVRPVARLVLVGDPDQLASVEAGAVLGDLVNRAPGPVADVPAGLLTDVAGADLEHGEEAAEPLTTGIVSLTHTHRFSGAIVELARAVQRGEVDEAIGILRSGDPRVAFVEAEPDLRQSAPLTELRNDVVEAGRALVEAARSGSQEAALAALDQHRLLCAHRTGPFGVSRWSVEVERWLAAAIDGFAADGEWYRGRPLLATSNDYELKLFNGDTGVVIDNGTGKAGTAGVTAVFARGLDPLRVSPNRLSGVQTVHAMTVHRSQGSQFDRVSVLLPPAESPLLTRELFYTAITRAQSFVRVVGSEEAVRKAVAQPIVRASGLRSRRT